MHWKFFVKNVKKSLLCVNFKVTKKIVGEQDAGIKQFVVLLKTLNLNTQNHVVHKDANFYSNLSKQVEIKN